MAINSIDIPCEKTSIKSQGSSNGYKNGYLPTSRLVKIDFSTEGSMCSLTFKHGKYKKKTEIKSPYLTGDSVHLLSRVTEKRFVHKKSSNITNITSSFPLATNIYKANSDEFKVAKKNKKVQKSVLTLPNKPAPLPESCTVSDMNDSEYLKRDDRKKGKMRPSAGPMRNCRARGKNFKFYDRDAQYCSHLDLDCSSAETVKKYNGDGKRKSRSIADRSNGNAADNRDANNVWKVLRNINRFQFIPSPPMSEDSFIAPKKTKFPRRRNNRKDMRVFETCHTEEIAYISNYEVDKSSRCNLSHSSSIDKITVIDKQHDLDTFCTKIEERIIKKKKEKVRPKALKNKSPKNKSSPVKPKTNFKTITYIKQNNKCDGLCDDSSVICPNYRELKNIITSNKTIDLGHEIKAIENEDDDLSINTVGTQQNSHYSEFVYSENSGSSKAAASYKQTTDMKDKNKSAIYPNEQNLEEDVIHSDLDKSDQQINGITRVVLSKAQKDAQPKLAESPKKYSYETSSPCSNGVYKPKLTKTAINRQLNNYKFPIVILNKNQLSSTIKVINQEHPQFNGLDKKIWPFMLNWFSAEHTDNALDTHTKSSDSNAKKKKGDCDEVEKGIISKNSNYGTIQSKIDKKSKKDYKRTPLPLVEYLNQPLDQKKSKPIRQFRDRMIKLLCKHSSVLNVTDKSSNPATKENITMKVDTCTDDLDILSANEVTAIVVDTKESKTSSPIEKRSWAKAKWASDFIDNVIRKIKSGAYYTHDNIFNKKSAKEPEQTVVNCDLPAAESINSVTIPGFDETLPAVEIKTMNMNEISVKHCVTNIMVYFDVIDPTVPKISVNNSSDLIPIDITKNDTITFKCQTSILNAMLPAELCSILPKMMNNITKLGENNKLVPVLLDKTSSNLSTISEVTQCESAINTISPLRPMLVTPMAKELWRLLNGRYLNSDKMLPKSHIPLKASLLIRYELRLVEGLTPKIATVHLFDDKVSMMPFIMKVQERMLTPSVTSNEPINTCTALQPYPVVDRRTRCNHFNLTILFENTTSFLSNVGISCFKIINTMNNKTIRYFLKVPELITLSTDNFKTDSFFNDCLDSPSSINKISVFANISDKTINASSNCIEKMNCSSLKSNKSLQRCVVSMNNNKLRRKGFVKLYRKYKRPSYASGEKVTPLRKIENLDDFSHALGSGKLLSGVFDNQSEHKIMSSIQEMKNWTTEINQRQALLVLLLTNKKDTPNLLRYRPVLLQGIALKRITKANELDMEIEVIERENLNGLSRFEGITYLPASIENQDNLLEELCWIAKTTASDYQKPFDESSEILLKSLLEKRKKLNPSYLRVMARYVGLGLLKSSGKK